MSCLTGSASAIRSAHVIDTKPFTIASSSGSDIYIPEAKLEPAVSTATLKYEFYIVSISASLINMPEDRKYLWKLIQQYQLLTVRFLGPLLLYPVGTSINSWRGKYNETH